MSNCRCYKHWNPLLLYLPTLKWQFIFKKVEQIRFRSIAGYWISRERRSPADATESTRKRHLTPTRVHEEHQRLILHHFVRSGAMISLSVNCSVNCVHATTENCQLVLAVSAITKYYQLQTQNDKVGWQDILALPRLPHLLCAMLAWQQGPTISYISMSRPTSNLNTPLRST